MKISDRKQSQILFLILFFNAKVEFLKQRNSIAAMKNFYEYRNYENSLARKFPRIFRSFQNFGDQISTYEFRKL